MTHSAAIYTMLWQYIYCDSKFFTSGLKKAVAQVNQPEVPATSRITNIHTVPQMAQ